MDSIEHEYDHFGPWLLQIKSEQDIPRQYFEHIEMILAANYCFKIPVKEERRKLHAGMLLYNKLIIIEQQRIVELSIVDYQICVDEIYFKDIQYINHRGDLLNGEISLVTAEKTMLIGYNLVSMDFAGIVMLLLRESINDMSETKVELKTAPQKFSELQIFSYFCNTENEGTQLDILNYQPCLELGLLKLVNLFQSLHKYRLLDSMYLTNGIELIIANRGQYEIQEHDTNYKFGHTFIPLRCITKISQETDERFNKLKKLTITIGAQKVEAKVAQDFVIDSLTSLLTTQQVELV